MTVHVGQTYRDLDPRLAGRTMKVEEIKDDKAVMKIVTNAEDVQNLLDDPEPGTRNYTPEDRRGKNTTIGIDRLEAGKDFALMADPPDVSGPVA